MKAKGLFVVLLLLVLPLASRRASRQRDILRHHQPVDHMGNGHGVQLPEPASDDDV